MVPICQGCGHYLLDGLCHVSEALQDRRGVEVFASACPSCETENVFIEVCRLPGENRQSFGLRKAEVQEALGQMPHPMGVEVMLVERPFASSR